jgi:hypothetical protein
LLSVPGYDKEWRRRATRNWAAANKRHGDRLKKIAESNRAARLEHLKWVDKREDERKQKQDEKELDVVTDLFK